MMHAALFIFYFLLLCLAITRMRFFRGQVKPVYLVLLFGIHVAAGCIHTWIAYRFYPNHGDIWNFFEESVIYKQELLHHPLTFLSRIFSAGWFNVTDTNQPLLDIQYQLLQYVNAFLDVVSFDNFYINTLLFSFPVFAGTMALFKVFYTAFNKPLPAFCIFLLPSVLFWTSVVYKDSLFYMAIGYFFYYLLQPGKSIWRKGFLVLLCTALMFISRANALITLLPAVLFFLLAEKQLIGKMLSLAIVIAVTLGIAIVLNMLVPGGLLHGISERQKDFQSLAGGSRIYLPTLEPNAASILSVFPVALTNGFFQPLPGAGGKSIYTAFSAELLFTWAIVLFGSLLMARKKTIRFSNFDIACLLFALPGMIIIGYMVPFAGAIIRYRSIYMVFLLAPFLNIIGSYPVAIVPSINNWLCSNVMVINR